MVTMAGSELDPDATGFVLDVPILVSEARLGGSRVAYFTPESAQAAGERLERVTPMTVWTALRELPAASGLVVDPDGERLVVAAGEVDEVLGAPRAESSILSRRRRSDLATREVSFSLDAAGRPVAPVTDDYGRRFVFAWSHPDEATVSLGEGAPLARVPLVIALRSNPGVVVILDSGGIEQVVVDERLGDEILAATDYFPRGYVAFVAELTPDARAPYEAGARAVAAAVRAAGVPLGGVWIAGYRLERAATQILIVVDADLAAAQASPRYAAALEAVALPPGQTVALLALGQVPAESRALVCATPDFAGAT